MRFIITVGPGSPEAKPAPQEPFDEQLFVAHMQFNEAMHQAGVLVASEGLSPGARGAHVRIKRGRRTVVDGPFAETKELLGGFYLLEVPSLAEATAWMERYPGGMWDDEVVELRQLTGPEDLPAELRGLISKAAPTWSQSFLQGRKAR